MTTLRMESYELPAADLGPENPLPAFRNRESRARIGVAPDVPQADRRYIGWRTAWRVLPYRLQDGYDRRKRPRVLPALVLENERLRAVFLPEQGGRLVSLVHRPTGRELLDRNPVYQPANLALRNAWISGGIEWNAGGPPGHHVLTCSPVFAARVEGPDGAPVLRLYEWHRVFGFFWQIDFHLPPGSPHLFARVRLLNPHRRALPMYWWTNMAVPDREDVRVLVPAETAIAHGYTAGLGLVDLPGSGAWDMTRPTQAPHAFDFFSRIPDGRRRWVAALDGEGRGLFETSTDRLRGRKLFCWGMGAGGRQWQSFLAQPGCAYIEIQAGLARTQMECIPMPAGASWEWTEAFGLLEADPRRTHGADWADAWRAADEAIGRALPRAEMEAWDRRLAETTHRPPAETLSPGSGWGALERRRRAAGGERDVFPAALPFPDETLGPEQAPWRALLERGALPERAPGEEPGALMTQPEWTALLERSAQVPAGDHWLTWWHLGNARMEAGHTRLARRAWARSLERCRTGWTLRNMAVLKQRAGQTDAALDLLRQAWEAGPPVETLAVEYAQALAQAGRWPEARAFVAGLPEAVRAHERLLLLWAKAALETGALEGVETIFAHEFATIREGEVTLTDLWFAWHERRLATKEEVPVDEALQTRVRREFPPPRNIDFRMAGD